MSEDISALIEKLDQINTVPITEAKGHLDHPEDLIFIAGSSGAQAALRSIMATVQNPKTVTIKWDGYPALIFGRDSAGRFSIMDKHMFNKAGGVGRTIYSPQQFAKYDVDRGVVRSDLTKIIGSIWAGLERSTPKQPGYYWGDLLFGSPLQAQDGMYTFRANPYGITYTVEQDSEVGKLFDKKVAGIAVHQFLEANAKKLDDAVTLNGGIGSLQNVSNVAIVPSAMPNPPKLKLNTTLSKATEQAIQTYGPMVDDLFNSAPQARTAFAGLFTVYVNKRVVARNLNKMGSDFLQFVQARPITDSFTETMKAKLLAYLPTKKNEVKAAFIIWVQLYKLKMMVVDQLAKQAEVGPIKGYLESGKQSQEGFVANNVKFVDRLGFSPQNLAGR